MRKQLGTWLPVSYRKQLLPHPPILSSWAMFLFDSVLEGGEEEVWTVSSLSGLGQGCVCVDFVFLL